MSAHAIHPPGGAVGFFSRIMHAVTDKPEIWFVRAVLVAALIAVVYYGGERAKDWPAWIIYACLGIAAVGFEYRGAQKMTAAWFERRLGGFIGWGGVWAFAFLYSINASFGVAANNQDQLTALRQNAHFVQQDAEKAISRRQEEVQRLEGELAFASNMSVNGKPVTTAEAAESIIKNLKAHKWWAYTEECKQTKGPQTREYCKHYSEAEAAKSMAGRKLVLEAELKEANAALDEERAARRHLPPVTSGQRADLVRIANITGLPLPDVELGQSVLTIMVISAFLTLAGILHESDKRANDPRRSWINWRGIAWKIRRGLTGQGPDYEPGTHTYERVVEKSIVPPRTMTLSHA